MANAKRRTTTTTITEFAPPGVTDWIAISGTLSFYALGLIAPWIVPGSKIWNLLLEYAPIAPERVAWLARTVGPLLALAHAFEAVLFDQLRMKKYGVARFSALWWTWELSVFVEGIGSWIRIGKVIAAKEKAVKRR